MPRNQRYFSGKAPPDDAYDGSGGYAFDSAAGAYYAYGSAPTGGHEHHDFPAPLNNIEFQPSETCPENFVIFDQTYHKSRVMFHPSLAHKLGSPGFDAYGAHAHEAGKSAYRDNDAEDTEDIDALLSSEEGEDDDVVSTGRTPGRWGDSPDTACSSQSKKKKQAAGSSSSTAKRDKMKKMVKTLKGIIPGGERMDTPAMLDEAVKYLKSLKVEVKKLGMKHLDN